ncbi:MAG: GIY-YIG nuclease family protein [Saprospiraceae bacterium]|nr:GIY-YIG nuclease family protein [Saprospiraceae bacterium]
MTETFQVYIIQSQKHGRFYIGMSSDPEKRLHFHNLGLNTSTRNGTPWQAVWHSNPMSKEEARTLEQKIKKRGAQRFLDDHPAR